MKHLLLLLGFLTSFSISTAYSMDASMTLTTFKGEKQNYAEVYLFFVGNSVHYKSTTPFEAQAALETVIIFKQGEKIVKADKFILNSPLIKKDSVVQLVDFADLKRYGLDNGNYTLEVTVRDINNPTENNQRVFTQDFVMDYSADKFGIADIQPISKYTKTTDAASLYAKNGFLFETQPFGFYAQHEKNIQFYMELYNTDLIDDLIYIRYFIKGEGSDETAKPLQMRAKRLKNKPIQAMILQLDITQIPSGNYELVFEVRDQTHQVLLDKKMKFQRSNPYLNNEVSDYEKADPAGSFVSKLSEKQLQYCLKAIGPKMENLDASMHSKITKSKDIDLKRKYLFNYWVSQDPQTPQIAFKNYMKIAHDIDKRYNSSMGHGFETAMGYVLLKYGAPSDIYKETSDPTAPPYEIWEYKTLKGQQNVKFVFANPSLAVNNFKLIHSTFRGEINNPNWQRDLYKNSPITSGNYIDDPQVGDNMGRNAGRVFDQ